MMFFIAMSGSELRGVELGAQSVFLHEIVQRRPADAEKLRGPAYVSVHAAQDAGHRISLRLIADASKTEQFRLRSTGSRPKS